MKGIGHGGHVDGLTVSLLGAARDRWNISNGPKNLLRERPIGCVLRVVW